MTDLLELAERCEAATGPDRDLDYDIQTKALGKAPNLYGFQLDPFTRSIDAAMTLVPEGFARCEFGRYDNAAGHWAMLSFSGEMECTEGTGATVSLALCAAALRARSEAAAVGGR